MKKASIKQSYTLASILLLNMYAANAASIPNHDHPTTFLGPTIKGAYTSTLDETTAYSIAGEAGLKNFRAGGTVAWRIEDSQRFKISAEYLWQQLTYAFFVGNNNQWVNQSAVGADYQYDLAYRLQLNMNVAFTHAPSKSMSTVTGSFVNRFGSLQSFADTRHIAGSNGLSASPGISFQPWLGNTTGVGLNYDNVNYDKKYPANKDARGFGGTVHLNQVLYQQIELTMLAAVRQPYNNYQAGLGWSHLPWAVGLDAAYTVGKNTLPNSYNLSLSLNYDLDRRDGKTSIRQDLKDAIRCCVDARPRLIAWTATPAVYPPEVLAIADDNN